MRLLLVIIIALSFFRVAYAEVLVNEIAWMGTADSSTNEWIELANTGSTSSDLSGWILRIEGKKDIPLSGSIAGNGYYLIERTDDTTVPTVTADSVASFGTGLSNDGATLTLLDASGSQVDRVDGSNGWKIGGGDVAGNNTTKETAQRTTSGWTTGTPTPRTRNSGGAVSPSVQTTTATPVSDTETISVSTASNPASFPVDLQIFTTLGAHTRTAVVGAPLVFSAQIFGLKKEPITNGRAVWSFGDGSRGEGYSVSHTYYYPGEYTVVLDAASGYYSASDRATVIVSPPNITLRTGGDSARSFVALTNTAGSELDLSLWKIVSGSLSFVIPEHTYVAPGKTLTLPSEVTTLTTPPASTVVLQFPNGMNVPLGNLPTVPAQTPSHEEISVPRHIITPTLSPLVSVSDTVPSNEDTEQANVLSAIEGDVWPWYTGVALLGALALLALRLGGRTRETEEGVLSADDFEILEEDNNR